MWSSAGSVGTVDLADISKIIFEGPLVQLGRGILPPGSQPAAVGSEVTATIRYGVPPDSFGTFTDIANWELWVSFRQGDGRVIAQLMEVDINRGTETELLNFDSALWNTSTPLSFVVGQIGPAESRHTLSLSDHAYYVKLSLSHRDVIVERNPPAVAALLINPADNG